MAADNFELPGHRTRRHLASWLLVVFLCLPLQSLAQVIPPSTSHRLSPGDIIQIGVAGRPGLSAELTLDSAGKVNIAQIGDVSLSGLTPSEAELVLRQRYRLFDPNIDQVDVLLKDNQAGGLQFFLIGSVVHPGEYSFPAVPSVWDLLLAAGGPADNSNLRQVRLIREIAGRTEVTQLDLSGLLEGGETPVVDLKPGDTLVIPALLEGVSAVPTATGVKVFGAVRVPTVVDIQEPTRMLDVLMLAGSPTADSEINKIYWVHQVGDVPQSRLVDLEKYLELGNPVGNPLVYPGDTLKVEFHRAGWAQRNLPFILGSLAAVATIWLAYDRINNGRSY